MRFHRTDLHPRPVLFLSHYAIQFCCQLDKIRLHRPALRLRTVSEKERRVVDDEITFLPLFCSKIGHTTWERTFIPGLSLSPAFGCHLLSHRWSFIWHLFSLPDLWVTWMICHISSLFLQVTGLAIVTGQK
jgi:hypothetical protein